MRLRVADEDAEKSLLMMYRNYQESCILSVSGEVKTRSRSQASRSSKSSISSSRLERAALLRLEANRQKAKAEVEAHFKLQEAKLLEGFDQEQLTIG